MDITQMNYIVAEYEGFLVLPAIFCLALCFMLLIAFSEALFFPLRRTIAKFLNRIALRLSISVALALGITVLGLIEVPHSVT